MSNFAQKTVLGEIGLSYPLTVPPPQVPKPLLIKIDPVGLEHKLTKYESLQRFGWTEAHKYKK